MTSGIEPDVSPYASALAARWYADEPGAAHRRLSGSLVSADLSGFTALSERLAALGKEGAERLTATVNGAFSALIDAAAREGGDVLKFGGDALLIWFEGSDDAVRAARAGARMQRSLAAPRFARAGLRMSVGAHHGVFDMFLVGQPDWRELVLLGEPVTTTVGLESAAQAGEVLVSTALAKALPTPWRGPKRHLGVVLDLPSVPMPRRPVPPPPSYDVRELMAPTLRDEVRALASLGGEHRLATIVFLELEGTDQSLAVHGPEAMTRSLDSLVRATQADATAYSVQFLYTDVIADGVKLIITAGAPTTTANDEQAALRFALDLVHGDPKAKLRAGVNRGRVFAGFLGSETRRTYTVMGDPVNLSARLMAHAQPGQVVASSETVEASGVELRTTHLPPFLVKGKSQPIDAVVVDGIAEVRRPTRPLDLPLVGRDAELARLDTLVDGLTEGAGVAVELLGDAGIGKSRLVREIAGDDRIVARVTVACQPYETHTAYAAARQLIRRVLGIPQDADRVTAGELLTHAVARVAPALAPWVPLIAAPADAQVAFTPESAAVAEQFRTAKTHEAVADLLLAMLPAPSLVHIEDAYYADQASIGLFDVLAARVPAWPWLLIGSRRPTSPVLFTRESAETLKLEPLSTEAVSALAHSALVSAIVSQQIGDLSAMAERSSGNPLFALQLVEARQAGVADDDLPESIERVLAERLDRLTPIDRTLLRHAAVLGARFDTDLLGELLVESGEPAPGAEVWDRLVDLVERDTDQHYRFRHLLYRDVAYEGLPYARRKDLHRHVGELLEQAPVPDVSLLSEHFSRADDPERTWRYSVLAGDMAWANLAVSEAATAYERALDVRRRLRGLEPAEVARVAETLGDVLERLARYEDADRRYQQAEKTASADVESQARLVCRRGELRERVGKYERALQWYARGLTLLEGSGRPGAEARLLIAAAGVHHRLGQFHEVVSLATQAAASAVSSGDLRAEAHAEQLIQVGTSNLGGVAGIEHGYRALSLYEGLGNVAGQAAVHANLGVALYFAGEWERSAEHYGAAIDLYESAGDVVMSATERNNLGEIWSDQGRWHDAITCFEDALSVFSRVGYPIGAALAIGNLGRAQARAGMVEPSVAELRKALGSFTSLNAAAFIVETRIRLVEALLLAGRGEDVTSELDRLVDEVDQGAGFPGSAAALERLRSWRERQRGDLAKATAAARAAVEFGERDGARFERALALHQLGDLVGDAQVVAEARSELDSLGVVRLPTLPLPI